MALFPSYEIWLGVFIFSFLYVLSIGRKSWKPLGATQSSKCQPPISAIQHGSTFHLSLLLRLFQKSSENKRNMSVRQLFSAYGHNFQVKSWRKRTFYTIEPKNLQSVFATDFSSWGVQPMRLFAFEPFVGRGIMCSDGALWEHSRSLIKPTFARGQIADLHLSAFEAHVQNLIQLIPKDESTIDLQPLFARLALDSSTEFLFGESVLSLSPMASPSGAQAFLEAFNQGQNVVGMRLHLPQWNIATRNEPFQYFCKMAHDFVDHHIANAISLCSSDNPGKDQPQRFILAHELVRAHVHRDRIRAELLNVFLPAHEAVGVALTNIFFNLARHPEVYTKLRDEILKGGKLNGTWTFDRLKGLKYLQQVINETFRLNPVIGTDTRMALRDTTLPTGGGSGNYPIFVRKGDIVTVSFYDLHRRDDFFGPDAHLFRPERWQTLRSTHWSYLPFGGGPRVCPGQNLALTEVGYTIVKLLEVFRTIENRDPVEEFVEVYKITTNSKNGAKVGLSLAQK